MTNTSWELCFQPALLLLPGLLLLLVILVREALDEVAVVPVLLLLPVRLRDDLDDVLVEKLVCNPTSLGAMLGTLSPDQGKVKVTQHLGRHILAKGLHRRSLPDLGQNDGLGQVRRLSLSLGVDSRQPQVLPHFLLNQVIILRGADVQPLLHATDDRVRHPGELVDLFDSDGINLVVKV